MSLLPTLTASPAATCVARLVTIWPLIRTRPERMSSSTLRRDPRPAEARKRFRRMDIRPNARGRLYARGEKGFLSCHCSLAIRGFSCQRPFCTPDVEVDHPAKNGLPALAVLPRPPARESEPGRYSFVCCASEGCGRKAHATPEGPHVFWAIRHARTRLQCRSAVGATNGGARDRAFAAGYSRRRRQPWISAAKISRIRQGRLRCRRCL